MSPFHIPWLVELDIVRFHDLKSKKKCNDDYYSFPVHVFCFTFICNHDHLFHHHHQVAANMGDHESTTCDHASLQPAISNSMYQLMCCHTSMP